MLGYWEPETQHEVWDANPDALIASSIALAAGRGRKADGGFVVTGRWPFNTGCRGAQWTVVVAMVTSDSGEPAPYCLLVKSAGLTILDDWYACGMAATLSTKKGTSTEHAERLVDAIHAVLNQAIKAGGSSLRDHRQTSGELGYFQHSFQVYGREGKKCATPGCGGTVRRFTQNGRSTFWCPKCQK